MTNVETNRSVEGPFITLDEALDTDKEINVVCTAVNALGIKRKSISHSNKSNNCKIVFPG